MSYKDDSLHENCPIGFAIKLKINQLQKRFFKNCIALFLTIKNVLMYNA